MSNNRKLKVVSVDSHLKRRRFQSDSFASFPSVHGTRIQLHILDVNTHAHSLTISWSCLFHLKERYVASVIRR